MPERQGDIAIEERVNSGQCELSHFMPAHSEEDMVTSKNKSAYKRWIWSDETMRRSHQSTRRDVSYLEVPSLPDYVISQMIRIGDKTWTYQTENALTARRRIFTEKNQTVQLDMEETLSYLSASPGAPRHEEVKKQLQTEMADVNNQVIMQLMYGRIRAGETLLPSCSKKLSSVAQAS